MTTTSHVYHPPSTCVYTRKSNEQTTTSYYSQAAGPCTFETKWCQLSGLANMASWKSWGYRHKISPTWKIPWNRQEIFLLQITKLGLGSCVINGSFCYNEGSAHLAFKGSRHRCGTLVRSLVCTRPGGQWCHLTKSWGASHEVKNIFQPSIFSCSSWFHGR